jgi:hypothetical protein
MHGRTIDNVKRWITACGIRELFRIDIVFNDKRGHVV